MKRLAVLLFLIPSISFGVTINNAQEANNFIANENKRTMIETRDREALLERNLNLDGERLKRDAKRETKPHLPSFDDLPPPGKY